MEYNNIVDKILSEEPTLSQKEFANELSFTESYVSKLRNGKSPISQNVKERIFEKYPKFRESISHEIKDEAVTFYEYFEAIFQEIIATPKNRNKDEKYLRLKMNKNLYDFFIKVNMAKEFKEQGSQCFEEEFDKFKEKYLESPKDYQDYILLPCNTLFEIIEDSERTRKTVEECLNLSYNIEDYLDDSESGEKEN